jgi:hypothetical protein
LPLRLPDWKLGSCLFVCCRLSWILARVSGALLTSCCRLS